MTDTTFMFEASVKEHVVDDTLQLSRLVPYLERYPAKLFDPVLVADLERASERLAAKIRELQRQNALRAEVDAACVSA